MDVAGLVSSIITFVDFSWTVVRGTYDVYSSASGATKENVHIGNVLQDLQAATDKMRVEMTGRNDHEKALLELEYQCRELSNDLAAALKKLTAKRRRSGLQSLNIMLRSLIKEDEVRDIEKRLGEYRSQMILRLNLMLLERSVAAQSSRQLEQEVEHDRLGDLKDKAEALTSDNSILRHLYFDEMYKREDDINDATFGTFDWLLRNEDESPDANGPVQTSPGEEPEKFSDVELEVRRKTTAKISDFFEQGRGVFFLRGKPGSGKSTLMKYLTVGRGKPEVDRMLQKWAEKKKLVRLSAMFLLHGTPLQRSLEGFYRTLFFELLCQCPELTTVLFPDRSTGGTFDDSYRSSFRLETLEEAWRRLISIRHHNEIRLCISIDGMDELEGSSTDRFKFARTLNEWAESEDIKIICSGRPNEEFNIVFDQPNQRIDLQDLTRADIQKILITRFEEIRHLGDLTRENVEELVREISNQSAGVILWAVLVGKNLEDDIIHGKSLSAMKRTILMLPSGIEDLFNDMWQGLRQDTHQQLMLRTIYELLILYDAEFGWEAFKLSWLEDALEDDEFPYNRPIQVLPEDELMARLSKVRRLLVLYTKHFVEVFDWTPPGENRHYLYDTFGFIHRSAQEFIRSKLELVGSAPVPSDYTFDLDVRLGLMAEMSVEREYPSEGFFAVMGRGFFYPENWIFNRRVRIHQIQYALMKKLEDLLESRRGSHCLENTTGRSENDVERWDAVMVGYKRHAGDDCDGCDRRGTFSLLHLAVRNLQINYVKQALNNGTQKIDRESIRLGLLICSAGFYPNYELFELLVQHGADLDSLVEVYNSDIDDMPEDTDIIPVHVPLWLVFCFRLAFKTALKHSGGADPDDIKIIDLTEDFLILEHFLQLGRGLQVKFLAAPADGQSKADDSGLCGIDLAQIVRIAKPDNMSRLLFLLEPAPTTYLSKLQRLTTLVLQPQFPFRSLPQGATTRPYRRVSEEYLIKERWEARVAFDGEHELEARSHFHIPT